MHSVFSALETSLASRWEGVRLPRASGKPPDFPGSSPNFLGSFSATSPEVLSLWNLTAIQRFPGSSPNFPRSSPNFPGSQPLSLGGLTPSPDSQKLSLTSSTLTTSKTASHVDVTTSESRLLWWKPCSPDLLPGRSRGLKDFRASQGLSCRFQHETIPATQQRIPKPQK